MNDNELKTILDTFCNLAKDFGTIKEELKSINKNTADTLEQFKNGFKDDLLKKLNESLKIQGNSIVKRIGLFVGSIGAIFAFIVFIVQYLK